MGYKISAFKGISWVGMLSLITKSIGFLEIILLAKILYPEQFGAYSIALLALGFLETVTETGVNIVLIQEKDISGLINPAWVVSIFRGIIISIFLFLLSPAISNFFNSPKSLDLLYLISFVPLIRGFINPSIIKFQKELLFNKNFWYRTSILILDTSVSILVTYITKNPIGVVVGLLSGVVFELVLSFILVKPIPRLEFNKKYIKFIFNKGKWITGSSISEYLFSNIDNIVVGRILGSFSLGIYQLAYSLSVMPLSEIGRVFLTVTVPIFVKISNDKSRLRKAFLKSVVAVALVCLPGFLILILIPNLFILILGKKWVEIVSILPILGAVGLIKSLSISSSSIFLALNKQRKLTIISFVLIFTLLLSIVPFVKGMGTFGAGLAEFFSVAVVVPLIFYFVIEIFKNANKNSF